MKKLAMIALMLCATFVSCDEAKKYSQVSSIDCGSNFINKVRFHKQGNDLNLFNIGLNWDPSTGEVSLFEQKIGIIKRGSSTSLTNSHPRLPNGLYLKCSATDSFYGKN